MTAYVRPFTGRARLSDSWLQKDAEGLELHRQLVSTRGELFAHSDHTPWRALIDRGTNANGECVFDIREPQMTVATLQRVAALCNRQAERFGHAVDEKFRALEDLLADAQIAVESSTTREQGLVAG